MQFCSHIPLSGAMDPMQMQMQMQLGAVSPPTQMGQMHMGQTQIHQAQLGQDQLQIGQANMVHVGAQVETPQFQDFHQFQQPDVQSHQPPHQMLTQQPFEPQYSAEVEGVLDRWVEAKRMKDFEAADSIRAELRAQGIDPDTARPNNKSPVIEQCDHEALDRWVEAKRAKDFMTADAIRDGLRKRGIDPDTVRPNNKTSEPMGGSTMVGGTDMIGNGGCVGFGTSSVDDAWAGCSGCGGSCSTDAQVPEFDPFIEEQLDLWVQAKRARDFEMADSIRRGLRDRGIDPDIARPDDSKALMWNPGNKGKGNMWGQGKGKCKGKSWHQQDNWSDWSNWSSDGWGCGDGGNWDSGAWAAGKGWDAGMSMRGMTDTWPQKRKLFDPWIEGKLDRWVEAKRTSDTVVADEIRKLLRSMGINPEEVRPEDPQHQRQKPDWENDTEQQLDRWVQAKRDKDFELADSIRVQLRAIGIDPDTERPMAKRPRFW
eukprot:TRINITY_DN73596_c0_g1_i1.p1 TRINITY_DN73596_c0_g1~~TRINITY_DN73596_c0_g1_i1.p1  ORF type:complete len:483 (+),score=57.21 TRINITY_DN73596_c0_g1_i1:128-1576(+)